ncbi:MAG: hypothetical protein FWH36_05440 [Lentimicrobiaceae bacterium]|nr:hypothetical protein [Lentimicrobiaceae bacterium]
MINNAWYDYFIEILSAKVSKRSQLVEQLMDLLSIEREAVYRRLRKEVLFSIYEIVKIAVTWNISLDEITNLNSGSFTFVMNPINYFEPSEEEFEVVRNRIRRLEHLMASPDSECMEICNKMPRSITAISNDLYRFDIFRWTYQYGNREEDALFSQTQMSEQFKMEMAYYYQLIKHVSNMSFIWDQMIFDYWVRDIQYFHSILLITDQEKELLRKELLTLIDYWSEVAKKGYYPETKNRVNIYISKVHVDTNYSYFYTDKLKISRIHAFDRCDVFSYDTRLITDFRTWMKLKKRTSVKISEVDEKSRTEFFKRQQKLIEDM